MEKETKGGRFARVAERRVNKILHDIRLFANCSNRRSYEWTDEQLRQIWRVIDSELRSAKQSFRNSEETKFRLKR